MNIKYVTYCVLVFLLALQLLGCNKQVKQTKPIQPSHTPAVLPASWPVPELKLPDDATICKLPLNLRGDGDQQFMLENVDVVGDPSKNGSAWDIGFSCSNNWDQLILHVNECILSAGFRLVREEPLKATSRRFQREFVEYANQDGTIVIRVTHESFTGDILDDPYEGYCYSVIRWE